MFKERFDITMPRGFISLVFICSTFYCFSQNIPVQKCGFDEYFNEKMKDEVLRKKHYEIEEFTKQFIKNGGSRSRYNQSLTNPIVTIPVVIHVLWNQQYQQISMAQVQSQIDVLNQDYQLLNSDTANTPVPFKSFRADCQISFCLAKRDPNGHPTTGVVYKQTDREWFWQGNDNAMFSSLGGDDIWDRNNYLNIWVVPGLKNILFGDIAGYAQPPGGNAFTDGVVIPHYEFGTIGTAYDLGRTATHEVGHWLNLKHIWGTLGNISTCLDGDDVDDTPNQDSPNSNCITFPHISCNNGPNGDMFMNYMDYSDDNCMNLFTLGQKDRMLALFQPGGERYSLLSSLACNGEPDLIIINQATSPLTINPGGNISVFFAEDNTGYASASPNYVSFHLSPDNILTPGQNGDIFLDDYLINQTVAPQSQTILLNKQITIPLSVAPGSYYLFFSADGTNVVNEGNETNNFATVIITVSGACPDLIIVEQTVTPAAITAGSTTTLSFKESNIGNDNAGSNYVSFHLSPDNILTPGQNGDIFIDDYFVNQTIPAQNQTNLLSKQVTIPASVSSGSYYLFFSADGTGIINECDNFNNFATVLITISGIQSTQSAYKYWFNNNFSGAVTVTGAFGNNYTVQANLSTSSLPQGLHTFTIGFKDASQKWSSFVSSFFYKTSQNSPAGYSKYEYWFDNAFGNRAIRNIAGTSNFILLDSFNIGSLNYGLHTINVRFKPDAKHWSSIVSSFFYKQSLMSSGQSQYEYWFDNNYSNKTQVNNNSTNNFILLNDLLVGSLNEGLHTLHIRFKPDGKTWSSTVSSFFYKADATSSGNAEYEYWFDNNYEGRTTTSISGTAHFILLDSIITNTITNGLHTLHYRFRPDGKTWSSVTSSFFYKDNNSITGINNLAQYVYWFDYNWQNPQTITITGVQNLNWTLNTQVDSLSNGPHVLSQAFKDDKGQWSSIVSTDFTKQPASTPVCLSAGRQFIAGVIAGGTATYQWQLDSGSGFTDISNNAVYSGADADTLQLTNAPTSWYGYKFRCRVTNGATILYGPVYTLKFASTWTGGIDDTWENPANWSCGIIPDANTDVYVNSASPRYPQVNSTTATCRSLNLQPGTSFEVKPGFTITITGEN